MGKLMKVIRLPLFVDGEHKERYKDVLKVLHSISDDVRTIKNRAVQLLWEWYGFQSDYKKEHGHYPNKDEQETIIGKQFSSFLYSELAKDCSLQTGNLSVIMKDIQCHYKKWISDIVSGKMSVPSYGKDQPIPLHNKSITIIKENGIYYIIVSILSKEGKKTYNFDRFFFKVGNIDSSKKAILDRLIDADYTYSVKCGSCLIWNAKKKQWFINVVYEFEANHELILDENRILGVDLGVALPYVCSVYGDEESFALSYETKKKIECFRQQISAFCAQVENRRRNLGTQASICGNGRVGHGRKTRMKPCEKLSKKISNFQNTVNNQMSKLIVEYAVERGCGVIQMEDLNSGVKHGNKYLTHWTYFDLQRKIEYKAKEFGIEVRKVAPAYTSQRCSKCGHICKENRQNQETFICQSCGFIANADFNASQNIAIDGIADIITETKRVAEHA